MDAAPASQYPPLFDRLPGRFTASADGWLLHEGGLQHALREDLASLFSARDGLTIEQFLGGTPPALHYGLPPVSGDTPHAAADLARLELAAARAIARYEPRLSRVRVHIAREARPDAASRIDIEAVVALGWHLCHVHFHVVVEAPSAHLAAAA